PSTTRLAAAGADGHDDRTAAANPCGVTADRRADRRGADLLCRGCPTGIRARARGAGGMGGAADPRTGQAISDGTRPFSGRTVRTGGCDPTGKRKVAHERGRRAVRRGAEPALLRIPRGIAVEPEAQTGGDATVHAYDRAAPPVGRGRVNHAMELP